MAGSASEMASATPGLELRLRDEMGITWITGTEYSG